jgi:hypothetical protein
MPTISAERRAAVSNSDRGAVQAVSKKTALRTTALITNSE